LTFNGLHGVIFQKIVHFIITAVRTSNPTKIVVFITYASRKRFGLIDIGRRGLEEYTGLVREWKHSSAVIPNIRGNYILALSIVSALYI
jgi:hypothetical protein